MSEDHLDEYEHYNFEQDKITNTGHSGKQRSKKEVSDRSALPNKCTKKSINYNFYIANRMFGILINYLGLIKKKKCDITNIS